MNVPVVQRMGTSFLNWPMKVRVLPGIPMKTIDEVRRLQKQLHQEYGSVFQKGGNHLSLGIGTNDLGEYTLEARLTNDKLKDLLPQKYDDVEINIEVIGVIRAL